MPDTIRLQLADADFTDPRKVAEQADRLWLSLDHNSGSALHKAMYSHHQTRTRPTGQAKSNDTTGQAKSNDTTGQAKSNDTTGQAKSNDTNSNAEWCFYHNRFGGKARKCVQPCKYPGNSQAGRQPPPLCPRSCFQMPLPSRHGSRNQRHTSHQGRQALQQLRSQAITAANGSCIRTFGKRTIPLQFNKRHFQWTFLWQKSPSLCWGRTFSEHTRSSLM